MSEQSDAGGARRSAPLVLDVDADIEDDVTSFPGAIGWTIVGTILPGLGFLKARRRFEGIFTLLCFVLLAGGVGSLPYPRFLSRKRATSLSSEATSRPIRTRRRSSP